MTDDPTQPSCAFEAVSLGKTYGNVQALQDVSLAGYPGEVLAICGANGAGKSTFSKLLSGTVAPSSGEVRIAGKIVRNATPGDCLAAGVLMMHQEPLIVEHLSVEENLWLFELNRPWSARTLRHDRAVSSALLGKVGLHACDLDQPAGELTPGSRHMLALARVFIVPHRLLVLDETTASTNEEHFDIVVDIVRLRKAAGACVIFVSHKLNEVRVLADRIAVLRDGRLVGVVPAQASTEEDISAMMIGERLSALEPRRASQAQSAPPVLEVEGFRSGRVQDFDLTVRPGEVVGLYGLVGSGRSTIGKALGGHFGFSVDRLAIDGRPVSIRSPREAIAAGLCYLTEDRHQEGFIPDFPNQFNMSLVTLADFARNGVIGQSGEARMGTALIEQFQIRGTLDGMTADLSGGNQQKVCVAKWAATGAKVYIIDEPTKGVDVGAKRQIHAIIRQFAHERKGVVLISSEAEEIMHLADRVLVMVEYAVAVELTAGRYDKTELISIALGHETRARRAAGKPR